MNKLQFRSVGQGLFYTGSLMHGTYNFVFDCGSESKQCYLDEQIDDFKKSLPIVKGKPYIDFVVISHLHKDHYSGLYRLLTECEVGKLYLPYLGNNRKFIEFAIAYTLYYNQPRNIIEDQSLRNLYRFMLYLYRVIQYGFEVSRENIVFVRGSEDEQKYPILYRVGYQEFSIGNIKNAYWKFQLYSRNFNDEVINELYNKIITLISSSGISDMVEFILKSKKDIEALAKSYELVFGKKNRYGLTGGLNITSLVLVHFPLYNNAKSIFCKLELNKLRKNFNNCLNCYGYYTSSNRTITMLTGDAVIDDGYLKYSDWLNYKILFCQVPHHGAKDNWESLKNMKLDIYGYVLSFGLGNKHKHPHPDTIDDIRHEVFYNVTQIDSFNYVID